MKVLMEIKPEKERLFRFVNCGKKNVWLTVHFNKPPHVLKEIRQPEE